LDPVQQHATAPVSRLVRPISVAERVVVVVLLLVVGAVLVTLAGLDPDPRGLGTHEQLGMKPCAWPVVYDMPCPTCGVTTATVHLLHFEVLAAFRTQPFGALLAIATIAFVVLAVVHLWRGESLFARLAVWPWGTIFLVGVAILLASWYYRAKLYS